MASAQKARKAQNKQAALNAKADRLEAKLKTWKKGTPASTALQLRIEELRAGRDEISSMTSISEAMRYVRK